MQRYSEYKDSGVQWLGEIPSHWEVRKMKFTFQERSKKGYPLLPLLAATQNHGVIRKENYENRTVEATKGLETLKLVEEGDFVISLRSFQGGIEICHEKGIISPAYTILRPTNIGKRYFKHLGKSPIFIQLLKSMVTGIREGQNIDYGKLRDNLLPIPSVNEQETIANYLDSVTAKIDTAIAQQQKMIDLLNERKQIIINNAVTKGLNPNVKMKDSGVEWIGEIPEHWEVRRLKHIFVRIADGTHFSPQIVSEGYPYITATDVDGKVIDYEKVKRISSKDFESLVRAGCKPKMGDILLVKDGATTGRVGMKSDSVDCVLLSSVAMLTPSTRSNGDFLMFMMMSDMLQKQIALSMAGAALPRITLIKLSNFLGVIPSHKEQIEIAEFVERKINPLKETISMIEQKINLLQERKQIIINDVVTGKVKII